MTKSEILLIVKDGQRGRRIERDLLRAGCCVTVVADAQCAVRMAVERLPDVVMLDQELPDVDSLEVCRQIRRLVQPGCEPVFMLTPDGRGESARAERAGNAGESMPWEGLQALIERAGVVEPAWTRVDCQGLLMDLRQHRASVDGRELTLTPIEFRLLWTLASDPGNVYDRQQLSRLCHRGKGSRRVRTIDVHVKSVRTKLGGRSDLIQTVHGVGYRFRDLTSEPVNRSNRPALCGEG